MADNITDLNKKRKTLKASLIRIENQVKALKKAKTDPTDQAFTTLRENVKTKGDELINIQNRIIKKVATKEVKATEESNLLIEQERIDRINEELTDIELETEEDEETEIDDSLKIAEIKITNAREARE